MGDERQPSNPPVNWPGLYRWSMEYHDGTKPHGLSKEDRTFLQNAIKEAMSHQENPTKVFTSQLAILQRFIQGDTSLTPCNLLGALGIIQRLVDDHAEMARDFEKLGAIKVFLQLLSVCCSEAMAAHQDSSRLARGEGRGEIRQSHPDAANHMRRRTESEREEEKEEEEVVDSARGEKVVKMALSILSLVVANNPKVQEALYQENGLGLLMNILRESPPDSSLRVKALAALACQMRHHRPSEISFVNAGGLAVLVHAMQSHNIK
ncbi:hsp70-binding protein 1, partial [Cystoisospora suis]